VGGAASASSSSFRHSCPHNPFQLSPPPNYRDVHSGAADRHTPSTHQHARQDTCCARRTQRRSKSASAAADPDALDSHSGRALRIPHPFLLIMKSILLLMKSILLASSLLLTAAQLTSLILQDQTINSRFAIS
jgi:hypothetical protein